MQKMLTCSQTISCLLIHPNPDSALNSSAAALLQEDYSAFSRQATLMTSIHARIPPDLASAVQAAKQRGDDLPTTSSSSTSNTNDQRPTMPRKLASTSSVVMKKPAHLVLDHTDTSRSISAPVPHPQPTEDSESEAENDENAENDPSLSPLPVTIPVLSPRRPALAKRPLSDLPTPTEPDSGEEGLSPSERNIAANNATFFPAAVEVEPRQEMMKLAERSRSVNFASPGRNSWQQEAVLAGRGSEGYGGFEEEERPKKRICSGEGKENAGEMGLGVDTSAFLPKPASVNVGAGITPSVGTAARKASAPAAAAAKAKGRIGLRRL